MQSRCKYIWGVAFDPELEDELRITLLATGFDKKPGDDGAVEVKAEESEAASEKKAASSDDFLDEFFG